MSRRVKKAQLTIEFRKAPGKRGGTRARAGRKKVVRSRVPHRRRARVGAQTPVHVTMRLGPEVASLRRWKQHREVKRALLRSGHKAHFRICHYSLQRNHLHLLCEPTDKESLATGIQGFASLCARRLNKASGRSGPVWADRYHVEHLETPTQVRFALRYVLSNWRRHGEDRHTTAATDPFSSADAFRGWREGAGGERPARRDEGEPIPVAEPRFWLLAKGWRQRGGLLDPYERPGPRG